MQRQRALSYRVRYCVDPTHTILLSAHTRAHPVCHQQPPPLSNNEQLVRFWHAFGAVSVSQDARADLPSVEQPCSPHPHAEATPGAFDLTDTEGHTWTEVRGKECADAVWRVQKQRFLPPCTTSRTELRTSACLLHAPLPHTHTPSCQAASQLLSATKQEQQPYQPAPQIEQEVSKTSAGWRAHSGLCAVQHLMAECHTGFVMGQQANSAHTVVCLSV